MLRYDRQTKPGLVAMYDIQPGNGMGLFLQPRSPHGAKILLQCSKKKSQLTCRTSIKWAKGMNAKTVFLKLNSWSTK